MTAVQTSIYSYIKLKDENKLGNMQQKVLECIKNHAEGINNRQISEETGLTINCVCGRVNELRKFGYIESKIISKDVITNRLVHFWGVM